MSEKIKLFLFVISILISSNLLQGQDTIYTISHIEIEGNKRTKESVILRELNFNPGDTIHAATLKDRLVSNQQLVMNTTLFTEVIIETEPIEGTTVKAVVKVREFWYIFPLVVFQLADRNFTIWWTEQNRSLDRVNYGLRFFHQNLTGRGDRLRLITQLGFLKLLELAYDLPMVGGNENLGLFADIHFSNQKQVAFVTQESRLQFFGDEDENVLLRRFRVGAGATYRDGIFKYHTAKIFYSSTSIGASIAELNPDYFLDGRTSQQHFTLQYDFTIDKRDVKAYPIKGYKLSLSAQKDGFGFSGEDIDVFWTTASYSRFFALGKKEKHTFGAKLQGRYTFNRSEQPYGHISAIGYLPNVLKGYEFFVVDGLDYAYLKTHFRFQFLEKEFKLGKWMFVDQLKFVPLKAYFTINNDFGYVNAPFNQDKSTLSNEFLWGRGVGLDFLFYYDKLVRFEYSFNHLGQSGLFFSFEFAF